MRLNFASCKKNLELAFDLADMLRNIMRTTIDRAILTVIQQDGAWAVELGGQLFDQSLDKDVVKASANKRARSMQDQGQACQVRISGEGGFNGVL